MESIWLKSYPKGVPAEIDLNEFKNIVHVIENSCKKFGALPAYSNLGHSITFSEVLNLSEQMASYFTNVLGLKKGDRVAIQMPNLLQMPIAMFGALRAGLVVVNTNPLYTPREMKHQFKNSGAKAIVILENFASQLEEILSETDIEHVILTEVADMLPRPKRDLINFVVRKVKKMVPQHGLTQFHRFPQALALGKKHRFVSPVITGEDIAFLQYTGGTTGVSKGAILTHQNIVANMQMILCWMRPLFKEGREVIITALPLYHIFCLTVNCMAFMVFGAENVLITNPKDIPAFLKEMSKHKFTLVTGVNTLFNAMMNHKDFRKVNFSHLKLAVGGGMALQKAVAERWFHLTKTHVIEGYGLTETSPVVCCNPVDGSHKIGTIGLPVPSTQVALLDDNNKEVTAGDSGEICIKGPQVMRGYWQAEEETKKIFDSEGWLHTGDIGVVDEKGFFKIVDRKKDMILVSGFNVYPNEIEDVLASHPKVLEVAAVGVPDDKSTEAVKVFIVKRDDSLTKEDVIAYAKDNLTAYKVPRHVEFRTELPKTNIGKILRRALRESSK